MSKFLAVVFLLSTLGLGFYTYTNCQVNTCMSLDEFGGDGLTALQAIPDQIPGLITKVQESMPVIPGLNDNGMPATFYAWNNVVSREHKQVKVEVARLALVDRASISPEVAATIPNLPSSGASVVMVVFEVKNNSASPVSVYPQNGVLKIGEENISLGNFKAFGDSTVNIPAGETRILGLWAASNTALDAITAIEITATGSDGAEGAYKLEKSLATRANEQIPGELREKQLPIK